MPPLCAKGGPIWFPVFTSHSLAFPSSVLVGHVATMVAVWSSTARIKVPAGGKQGGEYQ